MNVQIMVSINGADQVHLIKVLSDKTHQLGGKWLNSKISHIDDYFAGLIKIEIAQENVDALVEAFKSSGISVGLTEIVQPSTAKKIHIDLSIDAKDRPGIVSEISQVLSDNSVKVDNMECHRLGLQALGSTLFTSLFKIEVAEDFDQQKLQIELQDISEDLVIDFEKKEVA